MLPDLPVRPWMSFAYGSTIFKQMGHSAKDSLVDLIFIVEDAKVFHEAMLQRYPEHYSWLARTFPRTIVPVQRWAGAVWFNTEVLFSNIARCKYGVISRDDALDDLRNWRTLYLAGRLHKPVRWLQDPCGEWEEAVLFNRKAALAAALLLEPKADLLETIVSLSYRGDVRMGMAEAPGKISNIVAGQRDLLLEIYREPMQELHMAGILSKGNFCWDAACESARSYLLGQLPVRFRANLRTELERTVRWTSLGQTAKGLWTVPPGKALRYAMAKIQKRLFKF